MSETAEVSKNKCVCGEDLQKARKSERVKFHVTYRLPSGSTAGAGRTSWTDALALDGKKRVQKREGKLFDVLPGSKMTFKELSECS